MLYHAAGVASDDETAPVFVHLVPIQEGTAPGAAAEDSGCFGCFSCVTVFTQGMVGMRRRQLQAVLDPEEVIDLDEELAAVPK